MQLFSADATIFKRKEKKNSPNCQNIKNLPSKVAHNPTRLQVFSPASFCFVQLREFLVCFFLIFEVVKLCRMKKYPPDSTQEYGNTGCGIFKRRVQN